MSIFDDKNDDRSPLRLQNVPQSVSQRHAKQITEDAVKNSAASSGGNGGDGEQYSLNDDRRVKVLSPGAMVAKRFFRNRIAVAGLAILAFMFLFSFVGGIITPYGEDEQFYRYEAQNKEYAGAVENEDFRFIAAEGQKYDNATNAQFIKALKAIPAEDLEAESAPAAKPTIVKPSAQGAGSLTSFTYRNSTYYIYREGEDFYRVALGDGTTVAIVYKDIISSSVEGRKLSFDFQYNALRAKVNGETSFEADGETYELDEDGVVTTAAGQEIAFISRYAINAIYQDVFLSRAFKEEVQDSLAEAKENGTAEFLFTNEEYRFSAAEGQAYDSARQAEFIMAVNAVPAGSRTSFTYQDTTYSFYQEGEDFYRVALEDGTTVAIEYKDMISFEDEKLSFDFQYSALRAKANGETSFKVDGTAYELDENGTVYEMDGDGKLRELDDDDTDSEQEKDAGTVAAGKAVAYISRENEFLVKWDPSHSDWQILQETEARVYDTYASPSLAHWLGTDGNGMDMLTRLMYGGRVSLIIGFIVELIAAILGIILGGLAGYFGKWVDNLIMRIVDIFYCIPSLPIIIILGAAMDAMSVDPKIRMVYLMLILGFLGWPGIARLIRGQILSLREQEFMTATEAGGIKVSRRIFKHLIPNVIPQIIVAVTMGIGGTIITEATLSFLGLGVKFPFASWGNIINDVNNTFVLQTYWFIWIPAGMLLLLTVLAFNLVGDGLRDAFDPKMKR